MSTYTSERYHPAVPACQSPVGTRLFDVRLVFNGRQLQLRCDSIVKSYPAASGTVGKYAPIPKGRYWVQPAELWTRNFVRDAGICVAGLISAGRCRELVEAHRGAWGDYRLTIHPYPGTDTGNRGGFFIHGGTALGSAGCIDLAVNMNSFVADLESALGDHPGNCYIDLEVA